MSEEKHVRCLLCNNSQLHSLNRYAGHYLVQCNNCKFVFAETIPSEQELIQHYERYDRRKYLSPVTIQRYRELLNYFEKYGTSRRLLDVGCGAGHFLDLAKQQNWEVDGTELTDEAVEICRGKGINILQGKLSPGNYPPESFDVITSFEVLEHINNPLEEVKNFYTLLRKGGIVYVTTPNFNAWSRFLLKEKWNVLAYPEHLCYYSAQTLKKLFTMSGFSLLRLQTTGISITRAKTSLGICSLQRTSASTDDEKLRTMLESHAILRTAKAAMNSMLSSVNGGDSIKATFIKN